MRDEEGEGVRGEEGVRDEDCREGGRYLWGGDVERINMGGGMFACCKLAGCCWLRISCVCVRWTVATGQHCLCRDVCQPVFLIAPGRLAHSLGLYTYMN